MKAISLNGEWILKNPNTGETYAATVPGDVHNDLMKAAVISDPYYSDNANACGWVAEQDWILEKTFTVTEEMAKNRLNLIFNGIDTYSEISINGKKIADTSNMFLRYTYNITDKVIVGENTVSVRILSIREKEKEFPEEGFFGCFNVRRIFMRKAQCHFSWDWAPNFPAMGIWNDVSIEVLEGNVIDKVMVKPELDGRAAFFIHMAKDYDNEDTEGKYLRVKLWDKDVALEKTVAVSGTKNVCNFVVENAKLWWPVGMGAPNLYNYEVTLIEDDVETYVKTGRFGFRTVELDQSPMNELQFKCNFKINGEFVFLKGANWVPLDIMTGCITEEKYRKAIDMALDANFNCLRVWGGGIYERDLFFDICDEKGLLVWQDFQFACGDVPDDYPGFTEQVIEEVEYQIGRLQTHPAFFVATGGNEKTGSYGKGKSRGDKLVYYTLRGMCQHLDGTRPYMPSSPYSFTDVGNDWTAGDSHVNSYQKSLGQGRFLEFRDVLAGFHVPMASEIAVQGACRVESLKKYIPEESLWPVNDIYNLHFTRNPYDGQGGIPFVQTQIKAARELLGKSEGLHEFVKRSMTLHSEFVRADGEYHRSNKGNCGGAMFWMFSDIWPSGTWAILDYYMIPKAAYYSAKRAFEPLVPIITKHEDGTALYIVNDTMDEVSGTVSIRVTDAEGNIHAERTESVVAGANASTRIMSLDDMIICGSQHIFVAELDVNGKKVKTFYYPDLWKDIEWKNPELEVQIERKCEKCATVTITAKSALARMVNLLVPELSGTYFSDNFFDMEKGETKVVEIKADAPFATEDVVVKSWIDEWDR